MRVTYQQILKGEYSMKLNVMSDVHNEFSVLPIPKTDADVVILAGDIHLGNRAIDWAQQFEKPVIYLMGNLNTTRSTSRA